ncbi:MAG: tripartite tricarboxylate transporter substrate-binding protein [Rhodobacteraceae bacterium]|nr:tripartite tricarboxylate transporter substrate-binding protein [Paracoccaceae bacterium]
MFLNIKTLLFCAAAAVAGTAPFAVQANDFTLEGKTVTWIVGFSEGGGTDRLTRVLQTKLSDHLPGNPNVIVLNKPGGGSVIASNDFHKNAPADGTTLIMASTSTLLPVLLGSKVAEYDPNEWVAITGFARGATMYAISDELGLSGTDMQADYEALKSANIRFGTETPLSAELLDFVSMEMLGVDARYVFGLSSKDAEAAFQRAEMNVNTDNTRSYLKDYGDDPKVNPVWSYGVIDAAGQLQRDPDLPDIPTFPEFYEAVRGESPSGTAYELQKSLMNAKVMLSKAVMLPKGTPDHIRDVYIKALKAVTSEPDVVAALPREIGSMPLNFGDETQRAMALGTQMAPEVRAWAARFLEERFDTSLD